MAYNQLSGRTFEDIIEGLFTFMGYNTQTNTVLHTRSTPIRAIIYHPKGTKRMLIECTNIGEPVGVHEVERFCNKVAFAREKAQADCGLLVTTSRFTEEAVSWVAKNCTFVELRTYKQLLHFSARFSKLLKKFVT